MADKVTVERHAVFCPIVKFDEVTGQVWGVIAEEKLDKDKEIFDYKTSKPNFLAWNEKFKTATEGKSLGNVRAMHGKVAAGKLVSVEYDDAAKVISVCAEIVDPTEKTKLAAGLYTGFSIGAKALKWKDGTAYRYTADPFEVSIVDNPCMYGATFTMVKGTEVPGATVEQAIKFVGGGDKPEDTPSSTGTEPAAPAAAAETHKEAGAAAAGQPAPVAAPAVPAPATEKSMMDVQDMASCIMCLNSLLGWVQWDADVEQDGSPIPGRIKAVLADMVSILVDLAAEEGAELIGDETGKLVEMKQDGTKKSLLVPDKVLALRKSTGTEKPGLQPAVPAPVVPVQPVITTPAVQPADKAATPPASATPAAPAAAPEVQKIEGTATEQGVTFKGVQPNTSYVLLEKAAHDALQSTVQKMTADLGTIKAEVEKLKAQPAKANVVLRAVSRDGSETAASYKTADGEKTLEEVAKSASPQNPAPTEAAVDIIKNIHRAPR